MANSYVCIKKKRSMHTLSLLHYHYTVWLQPNWIKVSDWSQILPQHQSTYLRGPESASINRSIRTQFIRFSKTVSCEVNLYGLFHVLYLTYQIVSQSYSRVMVLVQLSFHTTWASLFEIELEPNSLDWNGSELGHQLELEEMKPTKEGV